MEDEDEFRGTGNIIPQKEDVLSEDWAILRGWPETLFYLETGNWSDICCLWKAVPIAEHEDSWELHLTSPIWVEKSFIESLKRPGGLASKTGTRLAHLWFTGRTQRVFKQYVDVRIEDAWERLRKHRKVIAEKIREDLVNTQREIEGLGRYMGILQRRLEEVESPNSEVQNEITSS